MLVRTYGFRLALPVLALAAVSPAHAEGAEGASLPAFVDVSRRSALNDAWRARNGANAAETAETTRLRASAISQRFAEETPAQPGPASPAPGASIATASIDTEHHPAAAQAGKTATARHARIKRFARRGRAPRQMRTASYKEPAVRFPADKPGIGPAGRMPTDLSNWNAFPAERR